MNPQAAQGSAPERRFKPLVFIGITAIHLGAIAVFFPWFFSWAGVALFIVLAWATASLGVSLCYHRLLSHKSWVARRGLRNTLLVFTSLALQSGPITWAATHRLHHRESDHEDDPHSPLVNFLWSHLLWNFYSLPQIEDPATLRKLAPDLVDDPVLQFHEKYFFWVWITLGLLTGLAGFAIVGGGMAGLQLGLSLIVWGFLARTVWVWHNTWFVNSVTHLFGYRNYNTDDDSRNLWWVAITTFGEGWHNNHHAVAGSARFGQQWWEFDPTWIALCSFRALGWVEKVSVAPPFMLADGTRRKPGKFGSLSPRLLRSSERRALRLAQRNQHSLDALHAQLQSPRHYHRLNAALALSYLGCEAKETISTLAHELQHRSELAVDTAQRALARIGDAAVPTLEKLAQQADEAMLRLRAQRTLQLIRSGD